MSEYTSGPYWSFNCRKTSKFFSYRCLFILSTKNRITHNKTCLNAIE